MKKVIIIIAVVVISMLGTKGEANVLIPKDAIRLRVLANSNSEDDLEIKEKVRIEVEKVISNILNNTFNVDDARKTLRNSLSRIDDEVGKVLNINEYDQTYKVDYGMHYFPEKIHKGVKYEEGTYESVLITLGEGKGDNWWCVLFPPLCLLEAEESDEVEYKFFVSDLIDKYFK